MTGPAFVETETSKFADDDARNNNNRLSYLGTYGSVILMRLHHIGIASDDLQKAIRHHETLFGLQPITEILEDPLQKVSVVLLQAPEGGISVELVAPLTEDSPVSSLLKRGVHLYHLCYLVEDLDETLEEARRQKSLIISRPAPAKLYEGRRIAFIYTADKYVVEFLEEKR